MRRPSFFLVAVSLCVLMTVDGILAAPARGQEIALTNEERAKLDTFEGVTVDKADKVFNDRDYKRAYSEYDAFILQFPDSKLLSYAILRKGRSLQNEDKRFEAIKVYNEVLDFFPNDIRFAGAALFYIGQCHMQNGDVEKAMKAWLEMAEDVDYSKHPFAATAINQLAENYLKQNDSAKAVKLFSQVAIDFRDANPDAARGAMARVVEALTRWTPDQAKLREFYVNVRSFEHHPAKEVPAEADTDALYWQRVRENVRRFGSFNDLQSAERDNYYRYWAGQMEGKFPQDDEFQIDLASFKRAYENDDQQWTARLDQQYNQYHKDGDFARVVRWIALYSADNKKDKASEYYNKLDFSKMDNASIAGLVRALIDTNRNPELAASAFDKLRLGEMSDKDKGDLGWWLRDRWNHNGTRDLAVRSFQGFTDQNQGKISLMRYYHWRCHHGHVRVPEDFTGGLELAAELSNLPEVSKEALTIRGNLLHWSGKYEEAIAIYQQADNPPSTLFWIAECYKALGRLEPAVAQLSEIENFFQNEAPEAALRKAYLYRDAGIKEKYVRSLRAVLKKYPQSAQSSQAHQELESMGLPIGGAVDAES